MIYHDIQWACVVGKLVGSLIFSERPSHGIGRWSELTSNCFVVGGLTTNQMCFFLDVLVYSCGTSDFNILFPRTCQRFHWEDFQPFVAVPSSQNCGAGVCMCKDPPVEAHFRQTPSGATLMATHWLSHPNRVDRRKHHWISMSYIVGSQDHHFQPMPWSSDSGRDHHSPSASVASHQLGDGRWSRVRTKGLGGHLTKVKRRTKHRWLKDRRNGGQKCRQMLRADCIRHIFCLQLGLG